MTSAPPCFQLSARWTATRRGDESDETVTSPRASPGRWLSVQSCHPLVSTRLPCALILKQIVEFGGADLRRREILKRRRRFEAHRWGVR